LRRFEEETDFVISGHRKFFWMQISEQRVNHRGRRRSLLLRTASIFRLEGKRAGFRETCYRDLLKTRPESIEPASDADRCDQKITSRGIIDPFDSCSPRGDASRCKHLFAMHQPGDERVYWFSIGYEAPFAASSIPIAGIESLS
jgi:hypothetical protein